MNKISLAIVAATGFGLVAPMNAHAANFLNDTVIPDVETIRDPEAIRDLEAIIGPLPDLTPRRFPSIFGAPSAVGARGGTGFAALTFVTPRGGVSGAGSDGDLALGYSIGDASETLGLTGGVNITSLDDFGDSGSLFVSGSHQVYAGASSRTFVGFQVSNLAAWGDAEAQPEAVTGQISHLVNLPLASGRPVPLQFTVGYGNEVELNSNGNGNVDDGAFVGLGVGISQYIGASLSATETQLNAGLGISIPKIPNVGFSVGVFDVTDNTDRRQFSLTGAVSF